MTGLSVIRTLLTVLAFSGFSLANLKSRARARKNKDPCAYIARYDVVVPSEVLACYNSFPFDPTLRDNIVDVVSKTLNFHTSTNYQLSAPAPFDDVHTDVLADLADIKTRTFQSDYALHLEVSSALKLLYDGHARYINYCYDSLFLSVLPFPLVNLNFGPENQLQSVFVAPEAFDFVEDHFSGVLSDWEGLAGFKFAPYAGARVLLIDQDLPLSAVEAIASQAGGFQGRSQRQNSFFSSYTRDATGWSYNMGKFAVRSLPPTKDYVEMMLHTVTDEIHTVKVPFISIRTAPPFADGADLWAKNCKATTQTNGKDYFAPTGNGDEIPDDITRVDPSPPKFAEPTAPEDRKHAISSSIDLTAIVDASLPSTLDPPNPVAGNGSAMFYMQGQVGILALGSFKDGLKYNDWFTTLSSGLNKLKNQGATHLIVDVTNNRGGYVCVAKFLHRFLAGSKSTTVPQSGLVTKARYNSLASSITQTIVSGGVPKRGLLMYDPIYIEKGDSSGLFPKTLNWLEPPVRTTVNGQPDAFSQNMGDNCQPFSVTVPTEPLFPSTNIGIVGNGLCASSCAIFAITMAKEEGTRIAVMGGYDSVVQQYAGTVGGIASNFAAINSEIKSTKLKSHPLAPPDFIGNAFQGVTWALGLGITDPTQPEEWQNHAATDALPLTSAIVNRPQLIWQAVITRWWPDLQ